MADRSALARFGGGWSWPSTKAPDGASLDMGQVIQGEGPGQGFAMLPWALDEYEKVLRLRPGESWLLRRMLAHAWTYENEVFLSMRSMEFRACVDRETLYRYLEHIEALGYVRRLSDGKGMDRRPRFSVTGLYAALAICIATDPESNWAKEHGAISIEQARKMVHAGPHGGNSNGHKKSAEFDLDFRALQQLACRKGRYDDK